MQRISDAVAAVKKRQPLSPADDGGKRLAQNRASLYLCDTKPGKQMLEISPLQVGLPAQSRLMPGGERPGLQVI